MAVVPDAYWKQLLAETAALTDTSVSGQQAQPMSAEDRKWLEAVMAEIVEEQDIGRRMERILNALQEISLKCDFKKEDFDRLEGLAEGLDSVCQFADLTQFFIANNGVELLNRFVFDRQLPINIRLLFAESVSSLSENNPKAQQAFTQSELFPKLLRVLADDEDSQPLRLKIAGTISCCVRSDVPSFKVFCKFDGPKLLTSVVQNKKTTDKLAAKTARILASITRSFCEPDFPHEELVPLFAEIVRCYIALVERNVHAITSDERYIMRDVLSLYMTATDLDSDTKYDFVEALLIEEAREEHIDLRTHIQSIINKLTYKPATPVSSPLVKNLPQTSPNTPPNCT